MRIKITYVKHKNQMKNIKVLDCTIRDGGYYNNWNFKTKEVKNYLREIYKTQTKVVEIGFNFFDQSKNYGQFAVCNQNLLKKIPKSSKVELALMINANELLLIKCNKKAIKKELFPKLKHISIIRVASHFKDVKKVIKYLKILKQIGFKVFLNLMQINTISTFNLKSLLKDLSKSRCVDVFYFADSFGNLNPKLVKKICLTIKNEWQKEIGFHSHDNCGIAMKNVIAAVKHGAVWIDSTIQGMGRGAGNVKTYDVLKHFYKNRFRKKDIEKTQNFFLELKKKYNWGTSKHYIVAAKNNIHPSYIQELKKDDRYSEKEINFLIKQISTFNTKSYDPNLLQKIYLQDNFRGKWNVKNHFKQKDVLILGQGPSIKKKKEIKKLLKFINEKKPIVISININKYIQEKYIDYYATFNDKRILVDHLNYKKIKKPLIIPAYIYKKISRNFSTKRILDYGAQIKKNTFDAKNNYCVLPDTNQSFGYVLALAAAGCAKKIFLFGFDGYSKGHHLNFEMNSLLTFFKKRFKQIEINSLSKTIYKIDNY